MLIEQLGAEHLVPFTVRIPRIAYEPSQEERATLSPHALEARRKIYEDRNRRLRTVHFTTEDELMLVRQVSEAAHRVSFEERAYIRPFRPVFFTTMPGDSQFLIAEVDAHWSHGNSVLALEGMTVLDVTNRREIVASYHATLAQRNPRILQLQSRQFVQTFRAAR